MSSQSYPEGLTGDVTPAIAVSSRSWSGVTVGIYAVTVFLGSSLVFLVQPMIAKMLLPSYGGSPSVWNTSLVFFQAALLIGYGYAHLLSVKVPLTRQPLVQLVFLGIPMMLLPFALPDYAVPTDGASPALWLILVLGVVVGLPYVAVTTTSPLLQRWFASTGHRSASNPYWLYAAGNAGSLLALLAYPFVVEPYLNLDAQSRLWLVAYACYFALFAGCALVLRRSTAMPRAGQLTTVPVHREDSLQLTWRQRLHWILLAFIPSSLMVGTTTFLSTDVASVPLLWIVPLSLYLVTFIFAFSNRNPFRVSRASAIFAVAAVASVVASPNLGGVPTILAVVIHLTLMFAAGMLFHSRLADMRPSASRLTEFFFLMSVGGVLGGAFNALIAPVVFNQVYEYPLVIAAALLIRPGVFPWPSWRSREVKLDLELPLIVAFVAVALTAVTGAQTLVFSIACVALLAFIRSPRRLAIGVTLMLLVLQLGAASTLLTERTFFGVHRVLEQDSQHVLVHGTTLHGVQDFASPDSATQPLSYYSRIGPLGHVFSELQATEPFESIGVIGLGIGTVASYGQAGQEMTFFEIDPEVSAIASNPEFFTFLQDTRAESDIVIGDGRLELESVPDGRYDLLVVDAFSSDSIPVHLLTKEAVQLYLQKVTADGVVAFNVSNRNMDLAPVLAAIAKDLGVAGYIGAHTDLSEADLEAGIQPSEWVVISRDVTSLGPLASDAMWSSLEDEPRGAVWTDQYSNIVSTIKWFD